MDQRAEDSCGYHGADPNGKALFDYTCDDCMLPWNHLEYDQDPAYIRKHGNKEDNQKGNKTGPQLTEAVPF